MRRCPLVLAGRRRKTPFEIGEFLPCPCLPDLEVRPSYFDSGYIKQKDWTALWRAALGVDYDPLVDVRNVKGGTAKAVAEVAKYPVKMDAILSARLYRAIFAAHLRSLIRRDGRIKKIDRRTSAPIGFKSACFLLCEYLVLFFRNGCGIVRAVPFGCCVVILQQHVHSCVLPALE